MQSWARIAQAFDAAGSLNASRTSAMSSFTSVHSRLSVAVSSTSSWHSNRFFYAKVWRNLTKEFLGLIQT